MRTTLLLFSFLVFFAFQFQEAHSKDKNEAPNFKLVGNTKVPTQNGEKAVEYDPNSPDHLLITDFNTEGIILSKRQFLFTGKKFDLTVDLSMYKNKILMDGSHTFYKNGSIYKTIIYKNDKPVVQNYFHPDGQMESTIPGRGFLNGEYKMWHSNGQLSFSGTFKDNLKNGEFEQFDESGVSLKKGIYLDGKLIDGEPIINDSESIEDEKTYVSVDIMPEFPGGSQALQKFIATTIKYPVDALIAKIQGTVYVSYVVDSEGNVVDIELVRGVHPFLDAEAIRVVKKIPKYSSPGRLNGKAVRVSFTLPVKFTTQGITKTPNGYILKMR